MTQHKAPGPDPLLDLLREHFEDADPAMSRGMRRGRRLAPARIAGVCAALVVLAAGGVLLSTAGSGGEREVAPEVQVAEGTLPGPEAPVVARVALIEGSPVLVRSGRRTILVETDQVRTGDTIESPAGSAAGLTYGDGTALVIDEGRLNVREADATGIRVGLVYGTLAARVPPGAREAAPLRISASNATLVVKGTVFTVSAERGRLTGAAVLEGTVEVRSGERVLRVGRSERVDMSDFSVSEGGPDASSLQRLARITSGVDVSPVATPPSAAETHLSVAERILGALERDDVDEAVRLADKHRGQKSIAFIMAAAEAYRRAGRWAEAADAYLAGAETAGKGKKAEKAMLRAADITLRKLLDPGKASRIVDDYLARFPAGSHLDEGLYLGGVASAASKDYKKARNRFEAYLVKYPGGAQVAQVHLQLAKIYALKMSDCASAAKHLEAIKTKGKVMAGEAAKIEARCTKKTGGEP